MEPSTPITEQLSLEDAPAAPAEEGFSGRRTAEIVGISYRQLDYWARTDLVRPSLADAAGSGSRRRYSYRDLLELKVIKTLLDSGIKLESVRAVFDYLRDQLGEDVTTANLVINGTKSVVVQNGEELIDVLQHGQGVLSVLALAGVKDEIDARILEFRPPATDVADGADTAAPVLPSAATS
ncbi:MAG: MerR family transcriptional regulator [Microthrixaceae bacterium]